MRATRGVINVTGRIFSVNRGHSRLTVLNRRSAHTSNVAPSASASPGSENLAAATPMIHHRSVTPSAKPRDSASKRRESSYNEKSAALSDRSLHLDSFGTRLTSKVKQRSLNFRSKARPNRDDSNNRSSESYRGGALQPSADSLQMIRSLREATRSGDAKMAESLVLKLAQYGGVRQIPIEEWEAALFLIAAQVTTIQRLRTLIDLFQEGGMMLTSRVVQSVVASTRRFILENNQNADVKYVDFLYSELVASRGVVTIQLQLALMQLYLDAGEPERALDFGKKIITRDVFSWTENAYHIFIKAHLSLEPPSIDTAFSYLRDMKSKNMKPLSHTIISLARSLVLEERANEALQVLEAHASLYPKGTRDEMYFTSFYMRCLALAKDERIHEVYEDFVARYPEEMGNSAYGTAALITYYAQLGDLDQVFSLIQDLDQTKCLMHPSITADLVRACAKKGEEGRLMLIKRLGMWTSNGMNWWKQVHTNFEIFCDLLSAFDIPPGNGPALSPTRMVKKLESNGVSFVDRHAWLAVLHYFTISRKDLGHVSEILKAANTKGLVYQAGDLDPVIDLLLSESKVDDATKAIESMRLSSNARYICYAKVVDYHLAHEASPEVIRNVMSKVTTEGTPAIVFYHHLLQLSVQKRNVSPSYIFETILPAVHANETGYSIGDLLRHSFSHYFNTHQYDAAAELLRQAVDFVLATQSKVSTELLKQFMSMASRHLPEKDMEMEASMLLRRLEVAPEGLGPALVKPLVTVNIARIIELAKIGHQNNKTQQVVEK
eukprot:TRINITY_DN11424_c0_g2_i1.p1 TRINITY_DN11424_c0_g2~~TRINITY_DN11424_c0_g2_i1.p1  ORF type:complete len:778 (-),score=100.28 TRINITY_DN11424_c0_g2_i1:39-2372(-)